MGYSPWGSKEMGMSEHTHTHAHTHGHLTCLRSAGSCHQQATERSTAVAVLEWTR